MTKIIITHKDGHFTAKIGEAAPITLQPNKDNYLELPANELNRKFVSCEKVIAKGVVTYDTIKETRQLGARLPSAPIEYNEEDAQTVAKLQSQIDNAKAKIAAINAKYRPTKQSKTELMYQVIAKKLGVSVDEVRLAAQEGKKKA